MGNRLFIGNLSWNTVEKDLCEAFEHCGEIQDVKVIVDRETGRSRGFAFITFADASGTTVAIADMDGTSLGGRYIRVHEAEGPTRANAPAPQRSKRPRNMPHEPEVIIRRSSGLREGAGRRKPDPR